MVEKQGWASPKPSPENFVNILESLKRGSGIWPNVRKNSLQDRLNLNPVRARNTILLEILIYYLDHFERLKDLD